MAYNGIFLLFVLLFYNCFFYQLKRKQCHLFLAAIPYK